MDKEITVDYWDTNIREVLTHEDEDSAIEAILDEMHPEPLPEFITIYGWRRKKISKEFLNGLILEHTLDILDDEYGNPDDITDTTDEMKKAESEFIEKILKLYNVWSCEIVTSKKIDVKDWVIKNCPEWLDEE